MNCLEHTTHARVVRFAPVPPFQVNSVADSFHERADAFEAVFDRSYSAFQLHCRGVRALRQALLRQRQRRPSGDVVGDPRADPDGSSDDAAGGDGAGSGGVGRGSSIASDKRDIEGRAETHLLRTLGAQLAELVTARECEKMVRTQALKC